MEVINDSLKNVAKAVDLIRYYLELDKDKISEEDDSLPIALLYLEKTIEILSKEVD